MFKRSMIPTNLLALLALAIVGCGGQQGRDVATASQALGKPASFALPARAVEVAKGLYHLGWALDVSGKLVEGYAVVHSRDPNKKSGGSRGGKTCTISPLAKGAKWRRVEGRLEDLSNQDGYSVGEAAAALEGAVSTWNQAGAGTILGPLEAGSVDGADETAPDGKNEVYFAEIAQTGVIAVTIVWGIWSGPPSGREIVEWDMVFDDPDFMWGDAYEDPAVMDFATIALHELGHSVGLADSYSGICSEAVMYGYGSEGQILRELTPPDIAAVLDLYN